MLQNCINFDVVFGNIAMEYVRFVIYEVGQVVRYIVFE